jgi:S-adenosylmethionine:diacylglycerol 3-amino-3-carboxypropyl transferase
LLKSISYTEIISQKNLGAYTITSTLFVNYKLVETTTNQEVWKENIFSQYEAKFDVAFYGQTRLKRAQERVVQDNLTQLYYRRPESRPKWAVRK